MFAFFKLTYPISLLLFALIQIVKITAQAGPQNLAEQSTVFNGSLTLSPDQAQTAKFTAQDARNFELAYNFDYSQYAGGSTDEDAFYDVTEFQNGTKFTPGSLLRVDDFTTLVNYSLASNLALSRILYVSENFNGTAVPASAFILWPFSPRPITNDGAPVVLFNHPTSGFFGPAAPSKHRALFTDHNAVYTLGLAGYAVVAPDYAGLGVSEDFEGKHLPHQYLVSPSQANDAVYAFQAARQAFSSRLSTSYVAMGHSEGGQTTWGVAELMARRPELSEGYLGAVAVSPPAKILAVAPPFIAPFVGFGVSSVFPSFSLSEWLTPFGVGRASLLQQLKASLAAAMFTLTAAEPIALPDYNTTWYAQQYTKLAEIGRKPIKNPMIVFSGSADIFAPREYIVENLADTCKQFPENQISFQAINGTGHVPTLDATRQIWLKWIEDRFTGKPVEAGECGVRTDVESFLPLERYQAVGNSFVQWAGAPEYMYEVPLAL